MPTWNRVIGWEGAGDACAMGRPASAPCLLSEAERAGWDRLCAWFLQWEPPTESYRLDVCTLVTNARLNRDYYVARIREGCTGQVQRATAYRLRKLWEMFGEKP